MATIVDRHEILPVLRGEFTAITELCQPFDEATWEQATCLPGWSVKDNLSHLVGTESMLAGVDTPAVDTSHLSHMANPVAQANEAWVESMRPLAGAVVLDRFRTITTERLAALEAMSQEDFDAPSWTPAGPDETYGRFMRIRHYDCYHHELDIRDAVGAPDRTDTSAVAMALTEPVAALGYIVGKRAGVGSGSSIAIHLTGPVEASYLVDVADRARVVDAIDGEPTASLTLDANLFLRLTGGRYDPTPHVDEGRVQLGGDEALARQVATHLAYTI